MTRALTGHKPLPHPDRCDAPLRSSEAACAGGGKLYASVFDGVKACCRTCRAEAEEEEEEEEEDRFVSRTRLFYKPYDLILSKRRRIVTAKTSSCYDLNSRLRLVSRLRRSATDRDRDQEKRGSVFPNFETLDTYTPGGERRNVTPLP
ncbi:hypothetical protein E2C01_033978 [Portunus trituberculatus]|uniref:Uncharacterized protein n=1 Tax=Portunus trituberculatus TaxID=210409 RepID=A0A5B7F554_PORTR|nr:hypothetical protein [Portunus trituberculatus]